ncbi:MAG: hypothetical protein BMS9Abin32_129 [Gammaproteobacteria bacterium]|nr:MAG: hypothetical protein BMS9Abin32_129 [Gammaproteobacteria bacterium]
MRTGKWFLAAIAASLSLPAMAEFTTIERAYEIALSNFRVPVSRHGSVTFRQCAECDAKIVRMSEAATFVVNGEVVDLKQFRKSVFTVRERAAATVIVLHHLKSNSITSVRVNL